MRSHMHINNLFMTFKVKAYGKSFLIAFALFLKKCSS